MQKRMRDLESTQSLLMQSLRHTPLLICLFLTGLCDHVWAVYCINCQIPFEATVVEGNSMARCPNCQSYTRLPDETQSTETPGNTTELTSSVQTLTLDNNNQEATSDAPEEVTILSDRDTALSSDAADDEPKGAEGGQPLTADQLQSAALAGKELQTIPDDLNQNQRRAINTPTSSINSDSAQSPIGCSLFLITD